ncbi:hypothetical protein G9F71_008550 [Clostridium sp. FP2]|uniref:DNA-directed RNA polymerase subunit alpha C-terminal domain-containing protein n=1 Tax=Clostridium sp. FP2 TaxID=2724481 RepID=UPI0013E923E2|nr:DNA-directed RNA polymerase subunit alpha C-terminal domain-containing protein [Clostridium sp. FP2]MBZ9622902.1 hypothetical protein [Clostridium sp. FP2]
MTSKIEIRNSEIIRKSVAGKTHEELAIEYSTSLSNINNIVGQYIEFKNYCNEMENYISKNEINKDVKMYNLLKLLKFHTRSINALIDKNIMSIEDLISLERDEICCIRRIGKTTVQHINECINNYNNNGNNSLKPFTNDEIILNNFNKNVNLFILRGKLTENNRITCPCANNQILIQAIKGDREYIRKLIDLVDNNQFTFSFLKKEVNKEFDRLEKRNEQLVEMLNKM